MIGKGRLFDLISRTADDANSVEVSIPTMMENYFEREEKYYKQINKESDLER